MLRKRLKQHFTATPEQTGFPGPNLENSTRLRQESRLKGAVLRMRTHPGHGHPGWGHSCPAPLSQNCYISQRMEHVGHTNHNIDFHGPTAAIMKVFGSFPESF